MLDVGLAAYAKILASWLKAGAGGWLEIPIVELELRGGLSALEADRTFWHSGDGLQFS